MENMVELGGESLGMFPVKFRNLSGITEGNHDNPQSGLEVLGSRFKPGICRK